MARRLAVASDGRVYGTNSWDNGNLYRIIDLADRDTLSNFFTFMEDEFSRYGDYSYVFFNEYMFTWYSHSYLASPTNSQAGLAWFREYLQARYADPTYASIKFPVSPSMYVMDVDSTTYAGSQFYLDPSIQDVAELNTDPDIWAKWWEWRNVVFAHFMHGVVEAAHAANVGNSRWKGVIYFMSPGAMFTQNTGVNLELLSTIPKLDWIVSENQRAGTYGTDPRSR